MNLVAAIRAALVRSPQLRGQSVEVVTDRCGHVTLNGTVSSCADRNLAEHVCWARRESARSDELRFMF